MCNIKTAYVKTKDGVKRVKGCYNYWGVTGSFITDIGIFHNTARKKEYSMSPKNVHLLK